MAAGIKPDAIWDVRKANPQNPDDPDGPIRTGSDRVKPGEDLDLSQFMPDEDGVVTIYNDDGSVDVEFVDEPDDDEDDGPDSEFDENLAEVVDELELGRIAESLLEGIDGDNQSRTEWLDTREEGIDLLGLKIERPRAGPGGGNTGTPLQGMSTAKDTTLLEAVVRGQANAIGEFLPATGPAKIEDVGDADQDDIANDLDKNFNYWLTSVATEYYPDTKRMFAWLYFGGVGIKKVYHCPLRRRPVSESIDPQHFIVSNAATDLMNADRLTHEIEMRQSVFRRMVMEGIYLDAAMAPPAMPDQNRVDQKLDLIEGVRLNANRPEDMPHTIYECYCELDIEEDNKVPKKFRKFRVPVPYKVTIEKDSRQVLEIRRHWREEDEDCRMRRTFVKYSFIDWLGFYGLGLLHLVGNLQLALTAMLRIAIDNGMFANFPGGLMAKKQGADQTTNNLNPGPGQFAQVDIGTLDDIAKAVMKLPYTDVTGGLLQMINMVREFAQRVAGTADIPVGEGKADVPVGTILAMIEQSSKVESAVHKGMHKAQAEEFEILIELLREDPEALFSDKRHMKRNSYSNSDWDAPLALKGLNDYNLVPKSDPNTPSHIHRIMKTVALLNLVQQNPAAFNVKKVMKMALETLGYHDVDSLLAPEDQVKPPSPEEITAQAKQMDAQSKQQKVLMDGQNKQKDLADKAAARQTDVDIADKNLAKELIIHGGDQQVAAADHAIKRAGHHLDLRKHAVDSMTQAHDAAAQVHEATKPEEPEPAPGGE